MWGKDLSKCLLFHHRCSRDRILCPNIWEVFWTRCSWTEFSASILSSTLNSIPMSRRVHVYLYIHQNVHIYLDIIFHTNLIYQNKNNNLNLPDIYQSLCHLTKYTLSLSVIN